MGKKCIYNTMMCGGFVLLLLSPVMTHAQIIINEIQYNPEGVDGGYEWVELYNQSEQSVSVEGYIFRESDKNHRLSQTNESFGWALPTDGYAIIADNPTKFLEKHPGFPGLLFDSSFTLVNTGELLEIISNDDELVVGFEYNPDWGGNGDGSTLGIVENIWRASNPTPGYANTLFITNNENEESHEDTTKEDSHITEGSIPDIPAAYIKLADPEYKEKTIKADAGLDRTMLVGVPFIFSGTGYGFAGGILDEPTYLWNFGDGTSKKGNQVIHHYTGPGTYTGTLKITSGKYSHTDHFLVTVVPPEISLTASFEDQTVLIKNKSPHTIEFSGFSLHTNNQLFLFPEESFIAGESKIVLNAKALGLQLSDAHRIHLRAPNDYLVASYHGAVEQIKKQIALRTAPQEADSVLPEEPAPESTTEKQIVYIGIPKSIEQATTTAKLKYPELNTSQAASLGTIQRKRFSTFEIGLFVILVVATGSFGLWELRKYHKEHAPLAEIEKL